MSDDKKQDLDSSKESSKDTHPEQPSKRKVVRHLLTGGGVIGASAVGSKWDKPTLESVILPAHGRSSPTLAPSPAPTSAPTMAPTNAPTVMATPPPTEPS